MVRGGLLPSIGASYPILSFLFAKVLDVFQILDPHRMTEKGDFFALMFFVMALAILFSYSVLGWFTNVIATVSSRATSFLLLGLPLHR